MHIAIVCIDFSEYFHFDMTFALLDPPLFVWVCVSSRLLSVDTHHCHRHRYCIWLTLFPACHSVAYFFSCTLFAHVKPQLMVSFSCCNEHRWKMVAQRKKWTRFNVNSKLRQLFHSIAKLRLHDMLDCRMDCSELGERITNANGINFVVLNCTLCMCWRIDKAKFQTNSIHKCKPNVHSYRIVPFSQISEAAPRSNQINTTNTNTMNTNCAHRAYGKYDVLRKLFTYCGSRGH